MSKIRAQALTEWAKQAYHGSAYHSFQAVVKGLTQEEAEWKPPIGYAGFPWADGSIVKIIFHTGADKLVQLSTALGESSLDWQAMENQFRAMHGDLQAALAIAREGHETVLDALESLSDDDLDVERPVYGGGRKTLYALFQMLIEHDFYHAGQIAYVRGLYKVNQR